MNKSLKAIVSALCLVLVCGLFMAASKTSTAQASTWNCQKQYWEAVQNWGKTVSDCTAATVTVTVTDRSGNKLEGVDVSVTAYDKNIFGEQGQTKVLKETTNADGVAVIKFNALGYKTWCGSNVGYDVVCNVFAQKAGYTDFTRQLNYNISALPWEQFRAYFDKMFCGDINWGCFNWSKSVSISIIMDEAPTGTPAPTVTEAPVVTEAPAVPATPVVNLNDLPTVIDPALLATPAPTAAPESTPEPTAAPVEEEVPVEVPEVPAAEVEEEVEVPDEVTEVPAGDVEEEVEDEVLDVDVDETPAGDAEEAEDADDDSNLPQTGKLPMTAFYFIGAALVLCGAAVAVFGRKKSRFYDYK